MTSTLQNEILSFQGVSVIAPPPYETGLEDVSLLLKSGELALIGVGRGQGISPLADVAQGLILSDRGQVSFLGNNWHRLHPAVAAEARGRIGRVFKTGGWISNLNLDENITLPQRHHTHRPVDEIYAEAQKMGEFFGLRTLPNVRPAHLKRSLLRRAEWARAFLGEPALIILEEPLKDAYSEVLHYLIKGIAGALSRGAAVLWITADMPLLDRNLLAPIQTYQLKGPRLEKMR